MAFSIKDIKGMDVGNALLSDVSKEASLDNSKTKYIKYELLDPSELNRDLSKNDIESLAEQIFREGLDQPLVVLQKENGRYEVLGGERRLLAIGQLIKANRYREDHLVECKVKKLSESDLPLSDDDKRLFTWLSTNQYRDKTDNDKYIEALKWQELIKKLREKGVHLLVAGIDEDGNTKNIDMTGIRTRELVAKQSNISPSQVEKIETINKKGTDELKDALKENRINIANAATVARMDEEKQKELLSDKSNTDISAEDVRKFEEAKTEETISLDVKELTADLEDMIRAMKEKQTVKLPQSKFDAYNKHIRALSKIIKNF